MPEIPPLRIRREVERVEINDFSFYIEVNGSLDYFCEREMQKNGARGHWILYKSHPTRGKFRVDKDQYSNDLIDNVQGGAYEVCVHPDDVDLEDDESGDGSIDEQDED